MITRLSPIEFHRAVSTGKTRPSLLICETIDGQTVEVIAKFSAGCEQGATSLAREVIAAGLAADLGGRLSLGRSSAGWRRGSDSLLQFDDHSAWHTGLHVSLGDQLGARRVPRRAGAHRPTSTGRRGGQGESCRRNSLQSTAHRRRHRQRNSWMAHSAGARYHREPLVALQSYLRCGSWNKTTRRTFPLGLRPSSG